MAFRKWIADSGGAYAVAELLGVTHVCVYGWMGGKSYPRIPVMREIVRLAKGKVTYQDIIEETASAVACRNPALLRKSK